jgi:hypothetical protein
MDVMIDLRSDGRRRCRRLCQYGRREERERAGEYCNQPPAAPASECLSANRLFHIVPKFHYVKYFRTRENEL